MAVHPFLQPAVSAAVETAVVETKGAPTAPTTDELQKLITQLAALINQQSAVIQQQQAAIAAFPQLLADAIGLNNAQFVTPGLQAIVGGTLPSSLDSLKELVQQLQADETGAAQLLASVNADRTRFAQMEPLVAGLGSSLTALTATVDTKAAATDLAALTATVATKANGADLTALTTTVAGKAAAADVTTLQSMVNTNTANIAAATTALADKAASADVAALTTVVNGKASTTDLTALATTVAGKALASDLVTTNNNVAANTTAINLRATTTAVTALQATVTQNTADIATKANAAALATQVGRIDALANTTVPALQAAVTQNTTDIAARATTAALAAQTGRIDALVTTTVPGLQTDINTRLLRTGDTATGSLMVPTASVGAAAPRFDQTFGGLNSPVRGAYNLGITAVALGPGPLTDPTPQGRKAQVIQVFIAMRAAPTLGVSTTIKIGTTPGGSDIYSKTYALTALPVVNNLLQAVPTSITELPAGTTLYAQAVNNLGTDGGKWDAIVQSYYKS